MSDQNQDQKRGVVRRSVGWYFGAVGRGAKGAVGTESFRQVGGMLESAVQTAREALRYQQCPRCREQSLVEAGGKYQCVRGDVCGFQADSASDVEAFRKSMEGVDSRILALSKGHPGGFRERRHGALLLSRLFWVVSVLLLIYGLSWVFDGRVVYALWVILVSVFAMLQAVKYAYAVHRLSFTDKLTPMEFLFRPSLWFPAKQG